MLRRTLLTGAAAGAVFAVGCRHHCGDRRATDPAPPPGRGGFLDDPLPPRGGTGTIPPPAVPTAPPAFVPDSRSSYRVDPDVGPSPGSWVPPPASIRLGSPTPPAPSRSGTESLFGDPIPGGVPPAIDVPGERRPAAGYLGDPIAPPTGSSAGPSVGAPNNSSTDRPAQTAPADPPPAPPVTADPPPKAMDAVPPPPAITPSPPQRATVPAVVSGLPGYAVVPGRDGVAAGRRPTLDGFDNLKAYGFRTVVYVHAPTADVAPARSLAEQRGLRFVPVAVSPTTLGSAFDEFAAAVADPAGKPVYVADADGTRAGGLWYLLFRTRDVLPDDAARLRADPLGLTPATTEDQKQLWLAIQNYLANR